MIFSLYYFLCFLYFFSIIHISQLQLHFFPRRLILLRFRVVLFLLFLRLHLHTLGFLWEEFSEKFTSANVTTSKVFFIFSTCFLTKISIFEEIALFSWVKCIKIGTSNPPSGIVHILGAVLATVPVNESPYRIK